MSETLNGTKNGIIIRNNFISNDNKHGERKANNPLIPIDINFFQEKSSSFK